METKNILSKKSQFQIKEIKNIRTNLHNDIFKLYNINYCNNKINTIKLNIFILFTCNSQ